MYYNCFLPSAIKGWNLIPDDIRNSPLSVFEKYLSRNVTKPPVFYFEGNRLGQIYHTRLRLECSSLKLHLFIKIYQIIHFVNVN